MRLLSTAEVEEVDQGWMDLCLTLARTAARFDEVPVGAAIVKGDRLVSCGFNRRERNASPTSHAEMEAILHASKALGSWRLIDCTLYVTLEPCIMCSGAIIQARLPRVVYGATDPKGGALGSLYCLHQDQRLNHQPVVIGGVRGDEASLLLREFFRGKRSLKRTEY